uniref:Bcl-2 Bcl-2 homology region 1-3 domain-containing protein n=1 Tax=Denticeps clupeoides TaxID=299321 RepID=A0AAY4DPQ3_9TELE
MSSSPTSPSKVFQDVNKNSPCLMLIVILDEHFAPATSGGRRRDLAWSAVLSVYVLAGQMALHCHNSGMEAVLPQIQECVGGYIERVICPELWDKGSGFVTRFGKKPTLEGEVKKVILIYFLWKSRD